MSIQTNKQVLVEIKSGVLYVAPKASERALSYLKSCAIKAKLNQWKLQAA